MNIEKSSSGLFSLYLSVPLILKQDCFGGMVYVSPSLALEIQIRPFVVIQTFSHCPCETEISLSAIGIAALENLSVFLSSVIELPNSAAHVIAPSCYTANQYFELVSLKLFIKPILSP